MAKINDTTTYPITTPDADDIVIGTDVSDTGNSPDGEAVNFKLSAIVARMGYEFSWHPYDMTEIDDGADGLFYDHSVDGDQSSVETPEFEDGYEYRLVLSNVSHSGGATNRSPVIQLYLATSASYSDAVEGEACSAANTVDADLIIHAPRLSENVHHISGPQRYDSGTGGLFAGLSGGVYSGTAQKISKARVRMREPGTTSYANIDGGKMRLYRRKMTL